MIDVVEDVADDDVVVPDAVGVAGGEDVRLAGVDGVVVGVLPVVHKDVALDVEVAFDIERVVAAAGEGVAQDLGDGVTGLAVAGVEVDGVVVAGRQAEDVVLDDEVPADRHVPPPDVLGEVVRGARRTRSR